MLRTRRRPGSARTRLAALFGVLAIEFADELFDGTKSAAMPLIRHDLALSYVQVGLLAAVPLLVGSVLELPFGVISGTGLRRHRFILAGGLFFIGAVLAAGLAPSFAVLLVALVVFFPASGVFVSLTQSAALDAGPDRRAQLMARWTLAGSAGDVAGPLLLVAVLAANGSWRVAFVLVAAAAAVSWLIVACTGPSRDVTSAGGGQPGGSGDPGDLVGDNPAGDEEDPGQRWPGLRAAIRIASQAGAFRWLAMLEVADLLLDVLTAFLALYLVAVVHTSPAVAALGVAVRLGASLAGDALLVGLLERINPLRALRASVWATGVLFPAFLLVPGLGPKLAVLAVLSMVTAPWYPILKAELFQSLHGRSGLAVSLAAAAGLVGGLGPLVVGLLAQQFGMSWAMASLCLVPVLMMAVPAGNSVPGGSAKLDSHG
jgi:MFS transporter, FSR family, fosmidomycin resistance protein